MNGYTVVNHVVYPWPDNTTEEGKKREEQYKKRDTKNMCPIPMNPIQPGTPTLIWKKPAEV
ncbi:hypothetical protein P7H22_06625 [Paenibacillus larvae]|nr:hypothetical protein [Paenibacillus larvae]MDT2240081.1 hypothetical protein [Paenibacillus larvae]